MPDLKEFGLLYRVWFGLVWFGLVWYGIGIGHIRLHSELYCPWTYILTFPGGRVVGWVVGWVGGRVVGWVGGWTLWN